MKRNTIFHIGLPFVFLLLSNCITPAIPAAKEDDASAVGITVSLRLRHNIFGLFRKAPDRVYFIREETDGNLLSSDVITSNFVVGKRAYLLNAKPGRYYAVAAFYETSRDYSRSRPEIPNAAEKTNPPSSSAASPQLVAKSPGTQDNPASVDTGIVPSSSAADTGLVPPEPPPAPGTHATADETGRRLVVRGVTILFPEDVARKTLVTVSPGHLFYMGDYTMDLYDLRLPLDSFQSHYLKILLPGYSAESTVKNLFSWDTVYSASIRAMDRSIGAIREFGKDAKEDLKHSSWARVLHL